MDRISKKTHFLKSTFHIFQIPSSIFILFYFNFPPQTSSFFIKIITNSLVQKKTQASSVSWVMRSLATSNLAWRAAITYQPNQLNSTNHQVSVPREMSTNRGKNQTNIPKYFSSQFFRDFLMMFFIELVRKTDMFHKPTKKHIDSATFSFHHGGSILFPNVPLSERSIPIQGSYLEIPQYSTFFVHLPNAK